MTVAMCQPAELRRHQARLGLVLFTSESAEASLLMGGKRVFVGFVDKGESPELLLEPSSLLPGDDGRGCSDRGRADRIAALIPP